jgi:hypothetical protein
LQRDRRQEFQIWTWIWDPEIHAPLYGRNLFLFIWYFKKIVECLLGSGHSAQLCCVLTRGIISWKNRE